MRAPGSATASSATSSAAPCCCTWSTAPPATWCRPGARCARSWHAYGGGLADKPELLVLNKVGRDDAARGRRRRAALAPGLAARTVMLLSGATGEGVPEVLRALMDRVHDAPHRRRCVPA